MNNTNGRKKLSLKTETIMRLDSSELEYVNGGTSPATATIGATLRATAGVTIRASARVCGPAGEWALRTVQGPAAGTGFLTVVKHRPQGNPDNSPSVVGATA